MGAISVEEAGVDAEDGGESGQDATARFVAYIQERKMVSIEEVISGGGGDAEKEANSWQANRAT
jgi:hypothetical protein